MWVCLTLTGVVLVVCGSVALVHFKADSSLESSLGGKKNSDDIIRVCAIIAIILGSTCPIGLMCVLASVGLFVWIGGLGELCASCMWVLMCVQMCEMCVRVSVCARACVRQCPKLLT
jgi:hypothetical protein